MLAYASTLFTLIIEHKNAPINFDFICKLIYKFHHHEKIGLATFYWTTIS